MISYPVIYCYQVSPIDIWHGFMNMEGMYVREIPSSFSDHECFCHRLALLEQIGRFGFMNLGWNPADVREGEGPYYFVVPDPPGGAYGYAVKADNNGTTYIACEVPLNNLENEGRFSAEDVAEWLEQNPEWKP